MSQDKPRSSQIPQPNRPRHRPRPRLPKTRPIEDGGGKRGRERKLTAIALPIPPASVRTIATCSRWVQRWQCPLLPSSVSPAETLNRLSAENSDTHPRFPIRQKARAAKARPQRKCLLHTCKRKTHDRNAECASTPDPARDRAQNSRRNRFRAACSIPT